MLASKSWRRLKGGNQLLKIIGGINFHDRIDAASETNSAT
jgi:hypothetical protein